ncbi:methyltransferase domain-containing protein [Acetobacter sp. LMG 1636]|uniref:Methyltransferase domain-containing protein n=2 Tax=Acetobacter fallax TaxID=1737473 RepID=A0ABX0KFA4_9PROT|nr:methyltransferase domain-containing protein [Acetobacter fallax]NHO36664.1 methyltransferase domain-containing protein [Acetobacter fallax]
MQDEVRTAAAFYTGSAGERTVHLLGPYLTQRWPDLKGQRLLGLGFAAPYLPLWDGQTALSVSARLDSATQCEAGRMQYCRECVVSGRQLPFDDLSFDRVLMIHALETSHAGHELLRAVWKVLRDDGRLLLVVPNRRGVWAFSDTTPFGQGTPFSQRQLRVRLEQSMFHVENSRTGLYPPPFPRLGGRRAGEAIEKAGRSVLPTFGGAVIVEAVKNIWGGLPLLTAKSCRPVGRRIFETG